MKIGPDGIIKSKTEIDEVWRRINRLRLVFGFAPIVLFFILLIIELIGIIWFNDRPSLWIEVFFKKNWVIILLLFLVVCTIFEYSKFNREYIESLRIPYNNVAKPYKKAEEDIIYGIQRERMRWVKRGVERLEGLNEYLSEMPEYNELLEKGRNWLKENERK